MILISFNSFQICPVFLRSNCQSSNTFQRRNWVLRWCFQSEFLKNQWKHQEHSVPACSMTIFSQNASFALLGHWLPKAAPLASGKWKQPRILENMWPKILLTNQTTTWITFPSSKNLSGRKISGSPQCWRFRCKPYRLTFSKQCDWFVQVKMPPEPDYQSEAHVFQPDKNKSSRPYEM